MPLDHDEASAEDAVREAIFAALSGTDYLPPNVAIITDVCLSFGVVDREGDTGFGLFCAGSAHSLRGLADYAYDRVCDAMGGGE